MFTRTKSGREFYSDHIKNFEKMLSVISRQAKENTFSKSNNISNRPQMWIYFIITP